jgi:hypothetical protein
VNISNGALLAKGRDKLFVCDLEHYQGTYILDGAGGLTGRLDGLMWFAVAQEGCIYYSNQRDHDYLYGLDTESLSESCLLKRPCADLAWYGGQLLFTDETDSRIYKYDIQTGHAAALSQEAVFSFIEHAGILYCACAKGLLEMDLSGGDSTLLTEHIPLCLNYTSAGLVFADRSRDFCLSLLPAGQREPLPLNRVKTQSIVAGPQHIYAANLLDNRSIVRLDLKGGEAIRFCGDQADKLHIVDDQLYFLNQNDNNAWYRMPLSGGRSVRVIENKL